MSVLKLDWHLCANENWSPPSPKQTLPLLGCFFVLSHQSCHCCCSSPLRLLREIVSRTTSHLKLRFSQEVPDVPVSNYTVISHFVYPSNCSHPFFLKSTVLHVPAMTWHHLPKCAINAFGVDFMSHHSSIFSHYCETHDPLLHIQHSFF